MSKKKKISIFLLLFILIFYYQFEDQSNLLRVCFVNVGQGDSIFIKSPQGKNILIDGGPSSDLVYKLGNKHAYRNYNLDLLILTHAHADHYTGLIELLKRYPIKLVLYSGIDAYNADYLYFKKKLSTFNVKVANLGQEYFIEDGLKIKILYPSHYLEQGEIKDLNDTSVSLIMTYQNINFYLAGDLTCQGEKEILKQNLDLHAEIYKVSHHGSRWSNCNPILEKLKPKLAIIQSGIDNKFKHPHSETLKRLEERNIEILRNDELGDIWIESDGQRFWIKKRFLDF